MCYPLVALPVSLLPALEESGRLGGTEGPDLTRYFVVCAMLLLVTAAVAWGFRRLVSGNLRTRASRRSLQVMDVLPLGGKRRLAVVRCYDRTFVLGLGDREISPIAELDPAIEPTSQAAPSTADRTAFAQALEQVRAAMPGKEIASKNTPLDARPTRAVKKKKVRRRKVKRAEQPAAQPVAAQPVTAQPAATQPAVAEPPADQPALDAVVADAARKMARARKATAQATQPPPEATDGAAAETPRDEAPPIQRLEGLLG